MCGDRGLNAPQCDCSHTGIGGSMQIEATVWRMGEWYKVYSEDTEMVRQLANADECRLSAKYYYQGRFMALDVMLPFRPKFGRRINRILTKSGFSPKGGKPNLAVAEILRHFRESG